MIGKWWTSIVTVVLVLVLLACAVKPGLAEAPPPPGDGGGTAQEAAASNPTLPDTEPEVEAEEEAPAPVEIGTPVSAVLEAPTVDTGPWVSPPILDAGGVAPVASAEFISDEQMLDAGGVLRAQGETLAALFAAGAIACPSGKTPLIYGGSSDTGCTPYYELGLTYPNPIQSAHDNPKTITGWWIWVSPGYTNSVANTILGKSVTVKGDPQGTSIIGNTNLNYPNITLRDLAVQNGQISSAGWSGTLRLQGVSLTGAFASQYRIDITGHKGSLYLANVTVANTGGLGAKLDATGGTGTVTVLNSAFNNNTLGDGLTIQARNAVRVENVSVTKNGLSGAFGIGLMIDYRNRLTLKNIYASDNREGGIYAEDTHPTYAGPVTLQNISANGNLTSSGLDVRNPGPLSGSNLTANDNKTLGIAISGARGSAALSGVTAAGNDVVGLIINSKSGGVSISNAHIAGNGSRGAVINSKSTVSVKNGIFYDSGDGEGLAIDNSGAAAPAGVTLTNLNAAENNDYGIWVISKGSLYLSGISARGNSLAGAWLETDGGATVSSAYGANTFNENGAGLFCPATPIANCTGVIIYADGAVSVSSASANANGFDGIAIVEASSARVSSSTVNGNFRNGMLVWINGGITLDRVTALHNHGSSGIELNNTTAAGYPSMALSHVAADHNNWGIYINSRGPVTLNHVGASYNTGKGVYIDSGWGGAGRGNVTLTDSLGGNQVSFNNSNNLEVHSASAVTIRGLNASGSLTGMGAYIKNDYGTGSVSVSYSDFNRNGDVDDSGLEVQSKGSISLNTVNASNNQGRGANLVNNTATLAGKTVSVSKGTFNKNGMSGLTIESQSTVTLNNVLANHNTAHGVYLDNYQSGIGTGSVSVSSSLGRNQFSNNGQNGLRIYTNGSISVSNAEVNDNGTSTLLSGISIKSYGAAKTATFTCVSAANNGNFGILIEIGGTGSIKPTLKGVWLGGNVAGGLFYPGTATFVTYTCQ